MDLSTFYPNYSHPLAHIFFWSWSKEYLLFFFFPLIFYISWIWSWREAWEWVVVLFLLSILELDCPGVWQLLRCVVLLLLSTYMDLISFIRAIWCFWRLKYYAVWTLSQSYFIEKEWYKKRTSPQRRYCLHNAPPTPLSHHSDSHRIGHVSFYILQVTLWYAS